MKVVSFLSSIALAATLTASAGCVSRAASTAGGDVPADAPTQSVAERPNQLLGTWRLVSAVSDPGGANERRPYGMRPNGLAVFSANGTFVEVLQSTEVPPFAGNERVGTPAENAAAVAGNIGQYGTYVVDEEGAFESDVVVGSSWPNRSGSNFQPPELTLTVVGDRLTEVFAPEGAPRLVFEFVRVP